MPKKLKLDLKGLKVHSFVTTSLEKGDKNKIKGGLTVTWCGNCTYTCEDTCKCTLYESCNGTCDVTCETCYTNCGTCESVCGTCHVTCPVKTC